MVTITDFNIEKLEVVDNNQLHIRYNLTKVGEDREVVSNIENYKPSEICIDNQTTFICKNELSSIAFIAEIPSELPEYDWSRVGSEGIKYIIDMTIDLSTSVFTPNTDFLFIFLRSLDGNGNTGTDFVIPFYGNTQDKVYETVKKDFMGCDKDCKEHTISAYAVNMYNGLNYAIATGDYRTAITFWNKINNLTAGTASGCNCH